MTTYNYHYNYGENEVHLSVLIGRTLVSVTQDVGDGFFLFEDTEGNYFGLIHHQDCCESVGLEDMEGTLDMLIGSPILVAEESSNSDDPPSSDHNDSYTWTFYKFATINGHVDMRFFGTSNGYYSERVDFCKVTKHD